jgi:hypothetical protein
VANGSLTGADIRLSSLGKVPSAAAADSAASATNATNATNAGHAAAAAALDRVTYKTAGATATAGAATAARVACDAGQHAIGGGVKVDDTSVPVLVDSYPDAANGWTVDVWEDDTAPDTGFTVYAICTSVTTAG